MTKFIYPQSNTYVIYTFGKNSKTDIVLKLLKNNYPVLVDCYKHFDTDTTIQELNKLLGTDNDNIIHFEFPIIFQGKDLIGNYDDLIHLLKEEVQ